MLRGWSFNYVLPTNLVGISKIYDHGLSWPALPYCDLDLLSWGHGREVINIPPKPVFTESLQTYVDEDTKKWIKRLSKHLDLNESATLRLCLDALRFDYNYGAFLPQDDNEDLNELGIKEVL